MKEGKLSEPVWERSVLKGIVTRKENIVSGVGLGRIGNIFKTGEPYTIVSSEADFLLWDSSPYNRDISGKILFHRAVNACAAMGAKPVAVQVQLLCPLAFMESDLKALMSSLKEEAEKLGISLVPGKIESSSFVYVPYLVLNGIGAVKTEEPYYKIEAGQELLLTKWIAIESTVLLARKYEKELLSHFTPVFLGNAQKLLQYISVVPEALVAVRHGVKAMLPIEEGGIFGTLWELAKGAGLGLEVRAKDIPIKQETIEICELYHKNPYKLPSAGSLLIVVEHGEQLKWELLNAGIPSTVIGVLTDKSERVLLNGEEKRFLELPKMNELGEEDN